MKTFTRLKLFHWELKTICTPRDFRHDELLKGIINLLKLEIFLKLSNVGKFSEMTKIDSTRCKNLSSVELSSGSQTFSRGSCGSFGLVQKGNYNSRPIVNYTNVKLSRVCKRFRMVGEFKSFIQKIDHRRGSAQISRPWLISCDRFERSRSICAE